MEVIISLAMKLAPILSFILAPNIDYRGNQCGMTPQTAMHTQGGAAVGAVAACAMVGLSLYHTSLSEQRHALNVKIHQLSKGASALTDEQRVELNKLGEAVKKLDAQMASVSRWMKRSEWTAVVGCVYAAAWYKGGKRQRVPEGLTKREYKGHKELLSHYDRRFEYYAGLAFNGLSLHNEEAYRALEEQLSNGISVRLNLSELSEQVAALPADWTAARARALPRIEKLQEGYRSCERALKAIHEGLTKALSPETAAPYCITNRYMVTKAQNLLTHIQRLQTLFAEHQAAAAAVLPVQRNVAQAAELDQRIRDMQQSITGHDSGSDQEDETAAAPTSTAGAGTGQREQATATATAPHTFG